MGAAAEAADLLDRALDCTPDDGGLWLELSQVLAWLGRDQAMEEAWRKALALLPRDRLAAAWSRRGRQMRTVTCNPEEAFAAYLTAESLLVPDTSNQERAAILIGLAWRDAVGADAREAEHLLKLADQELAGDADPETLLDMTEIRMQSLIRQGRFAEAAAVAWEASRRVPDTRGLGPSYGIWVNAACALTSIGDYEGALACAEEGVAGTRDVPAILVHALAAKAHILARLERFGEASAVIAEQRRLADRLDSSGHFGHVRVRCRWRGDGCCLRSPPRPQRATSQIWSILVVLPSSAWWNRRASWPGSTASAQAFSGQ